MRFRIFLVHTIVFLRIFLEASCCWSFYCSCGCCWGVGREDEVGGADVLRTMCQPPCAAQSTQKGQFVFEPNTKPTPFDTYRNDKSAKFHNRIASMHFDSCALLATSTHCGDPGL